jgi:hypothetical protein
MEIQKIGELAKALAKAQLEIKSASKEGFNPHFKSKYADLNAVWEACHEALNKNGLAITQVTKTIDKQLFLETLLIHESGEYVSSEYPVRPQKDTPQAYGSALTYARRYSLAAICGVCPADEDDDGNAASEPPKKQPKAEIFYEIDNKYHKQKMMDIVSKVIPYTEKRKAFYQEINNMLKGEPLASLEQRIAQILEALKDRIEEELKGKE